MNFRKLAIAYIISFVSLEKVCASEPDLLKCVNTLQGTNSNCPKCEPFV